MDPTEIWRNQTMTDEYSLHSLFPMHSLFLMLDFKDPVHIKQSRLKEEKRKQNEVGEEFVGMSRRKGLLQ